MELSETQVEASASRTDIAHVKYLICFAFQVQICLVPWLFGCRPTDFVELRGIEEPDIYHTFFIHFEICLVETDFLNFLCFMQ